MSEKLKKNIGKLFAGESKQKDYGGNREELKSSANDLKYKRIKLSSDDQKDFNFLGKSQSQNDKGPLINSEKLILQSLKNRLSTDGLEPRKDMFTGKSWAGSVTAFAQLNGSTSSIGTPGLASSQRHSHMSTAQISKTLWLTNKPSLRLIGSDLPQIKTDTDEKTTLANMDKRLNIPTKFAEGSLIGNSQSKKFQAKEALDLNSSLAIDGAYKPKISGNVFQPLTSQIQAKIHDFGRQVSHSNKTSQELLKNTQDRSLNLGCTNEMREYQFVNKKGQSRQTSQLNSSKAGSSEYPAPDELQTSKSRVVLDSLVESNSQTRQSGIKGANQSSGELFRKPNSDSWQTEAEKRYNSHKSWK
jgi:hypothetical protein